jgi:hypothetical protein
MTVDWETIRDYLETLYPGKIRKKRIRAIKVNSSYHWQPQLLIEVGKSYRELEPDAPMEEVIAIFESDSFLVCTEKRGGGQGIPYYFIREDVRLVIEYE